MSEPKDLTSLSREELVNIAKSLGIKPHHKAKEESLIYQIMQQPEYARDDVMKHRAERAVAPTIHYTEEQVKEAIKPFLAKEGFTATFPGDGTWIFRCLGAEDSGTLSQPIRTIVQRAQYVSRGRFALRTRSEFDRGSAQGKNAYTNVVLS